MIMRMADEPVSQPADREAKIITLCGSTRFEAELADAN
jgi:hypothetical protein